MGINIVLRLINGFFRYFMETLKSNRHFLTSIFRFYETLPHLQDLVAKFKSVEEIPCLYVYYTEYPNLKFFSNAHTLRCDGDFLGEYSSGDIRMNKQMTSLGLDNLKEVIA